MSRRVVGPFNRVEGDLEVTLESGDGVVRAAYVNSPLYRGFEPMLRGKAPGDALVITPRICGICSISQSMAAAAALRGCSGIEAAPNGLHAANLIHAVENIADHLSHFYLFFMPDFARADYRGRPWFEAGAERFRAGAGSAAAEFLPARAQFMHILGYLAGKWPHTLVTQPGGTTRPVSASERIRIRALIDAFRRFLEERLFGDRLEAVAALESEAALQAWREAAPPEAGDLRRFLAIAEDLALERLGGADVAFLSYGAYESPEGERLFPRGVWDDGPRTLETERITEDLSHAWLAGDESPRHPREGVTLPVAEKEGAYSWCKAPRLGGRVAETGALARQLVDGQPLIRDLVAASGGNVRNRVIARLLEVARLIPEMTRWIDAIRPGEPFCVSDRPPDEGQGAGLVEAARGSLGHWLRIEQGRIANYQIIAPTTWNFSPRDAAGTPGALEQALVGTPMREGEETPLAVQHVVRSFDPCMVCTVH
ncbi:MAG: nickel-dependent hydrogenase large subunit [Gammaproteobacteria bacterium]